MITAALVIAGFPTGPALADACHGTEGAAVHAGSLCFNGRAAVTDVGAATVLHAGAHGATAFIAYDAAGVAWSVASLDGGTTWTSPLPGPAAPGLRTPALDAGAPAEPFAFVQLATPMLQPWADALAVRGLNVHAFVPPTWFVVATPTPSAHAALQDLAFVMTVATLAPEAKVEPGLMAERGDVLVNVLSVPGAAGAHDAMLVATARVDAAIMEHAPEVERVTVRVAADRLKELASDPHVWWVDRASLTFEDDMDRIRTYTGTDNVQAGGRYTGDSVVGMVMDSGLQENHPEFGNLLAVDGASVTSWHGTNVFGIVFGTGVNPQARGMIPDAGGLFAGYNSGQTRYAHAQHLRDDYGGVFHTNSWGRGVPKDNTYDSYSNENDRVVRQLDVLMLQSMSNCGPQCARREAMAKNILSVGALYHQDTVDMSDDKWSGDSFFDTRASTGPASDGRIKPELVGPYDRIYTASTGSSYNSDFGGTSGATPVVAGAVGIVHDMFNKGVFGDANGREAAPATVKALLAASARPYEPSQVEHSAALSRYPDIYQRDIQGWGSPDVGALFGAAGTALVVNGNARVATGGAATYTIHVPVGATQLRVSLAWSDVPANPGATPTLVNDLDLEVRGPDGVVPYLGNFGLDSSATSIPLGVRDELNNLENVFIDAPAIGTWTVTVKGTAVNLDAVTGTSAVDQDFGLAGLVVTA